MKDCSSAGGGEGGQRARISSGGGDQIIYRECRSLGIAVNAVVGELYDGTSVPSSKMINTDPCVLIFSHTVITQISKRMK